VEAKIESEFEDSPVLDGADRLHRCCLIIIILIIIIIT
jgi:hypothetical protein